MDLDKELILRNDFLLPLAHFDSLDFFKLVGAEIAQAGKIEIFLSRHPTEGGLGGADAAMTTVHNPFEDAHVLAKSGPEKVPGLIFAEPIDMIDPRRIFNPPPHIEPVTKVITHIITAKREHGHRVPAQLAGAALSRGGHLRAHGGARINAVDPVESFKDQRHGAGATAPKDNRADRNARGVVRLSS